MKSSLHFRLMWCAGCLLLVPLYFWATGYQWTMSAMQDNAVANEAWIAFTFTGSVPYAFATSAVLAGMAMWLLRGRLDWRVVLLACAVSQLGTQAIKSAAKYTFQEPRPFVVALQQAQIPEKLGYAPNSFYAQPADIKRQMIQATAVDADSQTIADYQQDELGYSFPSGHTIFAASWLFLLAGLLRQRHDALAYGVQTALLIWAVAMLYSRVRLGMHYPIDLFVSVWIAWVWHGCIFAWGLPKWASHFNQSK